MFVLVGGLELCLALELCLLYISLFISMWLHIIVFDQTPKPCRVLLFTVPGEALDSEALNYPASGEAIRKRTH
jgi:hypothetical protein